MRHESDWPAERQAGEADVLFLAERRSHAGLSPFDDCEAVEPFVLIEGAGHDLEPLGQSLNPCRSLADLILSPGERLTAACASEHRVGWISPPGSIQLLVLQRRLVISGPAGVMRLTGGGLAVASPARPLLVERVRPGEARVQVEQAAGLGGGERDQVTSGFIGYEWWRGVCSGRGEMLSTGVRPPFSRGRSRCGR